MNPLQAMQMLKSCGNPQQFVQQMMSNNQIMSNPIMQNAMTMLRNGDMNGLQQLTENLAAERGTSLDEAKSTLMQQLGVK